MSKLVIEIDMNNAAFDDDPRLEVLDILKRLCGRIDGDGAILVNGERILRDSNGNTCGHVGIESNDTVTTPYSERERF